MRIWRVRSGNVDLSTGSADVPSALSARNSRGSELIEAQERIVTIFGGSKCREGDPEYAQALRVGALLADSGYTVCTGGYAGVTCRTGQ
jgi:hypothetical protein